MLLILAPSKTQKAVHLPGTTCTQPLLLKESELLIAELKKYSSEELASLMKMSEKLAQQTFQRISEFSSPFSVENASPAITFFQGDVYSRITLETYGDKELGYLQNNLRILSGLYGILRPLDLIQAYRLEMACKLKTGQGQNLYEFWGKKITGELNRVLSEQTEPVVVNLASVEYSRVIQKKKLQGTILQVEFKERKGDIYRTVAIHAKRARGMMVDFAVKNRIQKSIDLQGFELDGYCFRPEFSDALLYCFTRE